MTLDEYIGSLRSALPRHFAPGGIYHGEEGALRLARDLGQGLAGFPEDEVRKIMNSLYSDLLVRFTFGHVPIDNKEWVGEIFSTLRKVGE